MKSILLLSFILGALASTTLAQATNTSAKPASKLKVTGHYAMRSKSAPNSMEVQELAGGKIKFHILALWVSYYNRDNVHNGETQGTVDLVGDTAVYKEENCKITIRFTRTSAIVKQADDIGDCDFGANVIATGTYRKLDSRKPKFDY
ncbi:MAG TPA: hypothetical protein VN643_18820 [Pyrinomonadaceae bacterium]|nr:hypothetical protein [Pyrinomonadaceae bacterium]